ASGVRASRERRTAREDCHSGGRARMSRLREWWAEGLFIEVEGHQIFTRVRGAGPTLVFLHGFPTSSHDWAEVIADFAADFRCVTFDYLGYGASDKPQNTDYSSILQTDRALMILRSLGV